MDTEKRQELPVSFDEYQRYKIAARIIEYYRIADPSKKFHVLEVGANEAKHLRHFLPQDIILYTDIEITEKMRNDPEFQFADATNLPFEDGSFDFVIALDVLEHVPDEKRALLLSEVIRVASITAVVSFPYDSPFVHDAEQRMNSYYRAINREDYIWLKEHVQFGLPNIEKVKTAIQQIGCHSFFHYHGNLRIWESMYYATFDALAAPETWEFHREADYYYIKELFEGDDEDPCYRVILALSHEDTTTLEAYLKSKRKQISQQKLDGLTELLHAQRQIIPERIRTDLQRAVLERDARIQFLEETQKEIRSRWENDVAQWQKDTDAWKRDTNQWTRDVSSWNTERSQWNEERNNLLREFQIKSETWEQEKVQLLQEIQAKNVAWEQEKAQLLRETQAQSEAWTEQESQYKQEIKNQSEQTRELSKVNMQMEERVALLESENASLSRQNSAMRKQIENMDAGLTQKNQVICQLQLFLAAKSDELSCVSAERDQVMNSSSWRLTSPFRKLMNIFRKIIR